MRRRLLLAAIPLGLAVPFLWGGRPAEEPAPRPTLIAPNLGRIEKELGYHLLAPTQLPRGMQPGKNGVRRGAIRVLCDYSGEQDMLIIAQEKRSPERDAYNRAQFTGRAVEINGNDRALTTGALGERRLTFYTPDVTVILSSSTLTDRELYDVAQSMK